jgi:hypothetical protein
MMKRAGILGLAIVLTLGLGLPASQAAKTKKVASEVDIDGFRPGPPAFTFVGNVYAKKPKCVRNRTVTVFRTEGGTHELVGTSTSDETGDWELADSAGSGDYEVEVAKRKVKKGDKKLICKADVSPTYVLPPP